jgi:hypothetical protein
LLAALKPQHQRPRPTQGPKPTSRRKAATSVFDRNGIAQEEVKDHTVCGPSNAW